MANIWETNVEVVGDPDAVQRFLAPLREAEAWKDTGIDTPIDSATYPGVEFREGGMSIYTRHAPENLFKMLEQRSAEAPAVTLKVGCYDLCSFCDCDYVPYYRAVIKAGVFTEGTKDKIYNVSNIAGMPPELVQADPVLIQFISENAESVAAERQRIESQGVHKGVYADWNVSAVSGEEN
jgi:hypothetical protein